MANNFTILAQNQYLPLDTWKTKLNNNIMLVGASGRGKTRHFIKPNIMQLNSNYVISDPKGVLIYELGSMLENHGYKIKVLNLIDMYHSDTYNPFVYLQNEVDAFKLIDFLVANLYDGKTGNDPFWINSMKSLISAIFLYLQETCAPEERTFANAMNLLREGLATTTDEQEPSMLDCLFNQVKKSMPNSVALKQYNVFRSVAEAEKTTAIIQMEALILLQHFNLPEYIALTSTDTIDLRCISQEKTALFVITSDTDRSKNWLAGLFYSQLFDVLCQQDNPIHVRFILDDFVCTGKIPDFDYKMAMIRSRNLSCIVVVQDEAQLEKEYGLAAQGIITNCDSYVFLGASNIDICNTVASRLAHPRITGATIRCMDYNNCIVISGNSGGVFKKYHIEKHHRYVEIADSPTSCNRYNLCNQKITPIEKAPTRSFVEQIRNDLGSDENFDTSTVVLRDSTFDSLEEKYLHSIISHISNINVCVHQHLRDIFTSDTKELSKKLSYMHCDFAFRNLKMEMLFGVEIDGIQHIEDKRQFANDLLKDRLFAENKIPLLRFTANDVRENCRMVIEKILDAANSFGNLPCILDEYAVYQTSAFNFHIWKMMQNSPAEEKYISHIDDVVERASTEPPLEVNKTSSTTEFSTFDCLEIDNEETGSYHAEPKDEECLTGQLLNDLVENQDIDEEEFGRAYLTMLEEEERLAQLRDEMADQDESPETIARLLAQLEEVATELQATLPVVTDDDDPPM